MICTLYSWTSISWTQISQIFVYGEVIVVSPNHLFLKNFILDILNTWIFWSFSQSRLLWDNKVWLYIHDFAKTPLSVCAVNNCKPTFTLLCDLPVENWFAATYFCNQTNAWHLKNGNTKDKRLIYIDKYLQQQDSNKPHKIFLHTNKSWFSVVIKKIMNFFTNKADIVCVCHIIPQLKSASVSWLRCRPRRFAGPWHTAVAWTLPALVLR